MAEIKNQKRRMNIPLSRLIGLGFGAFVALAIASVLLLSVMANFQNTFSLLNDKAILITQSMETQLRRHFQSLEIAVVNLKPFFDNGTIDVHDRAGALRELQLAAAINPTITVLVVTPMHGHRFGVYKERGKDPVPFHEHMPERGKNSYRLSTFEADSPPKWGPLVHNRYGQFANVSVPLVRDGRIIATLTAASSLEDLGRSIADLDEGPDMTAFIIANGDEVIMHSDMVWMQTGGAPKGDLPSPRLEFGDPVLAAIGREEKLSEFKKAAEAGIEVSAISVQDEEFIMMRAVIPGFSDEPWVIGQYFQSASISREVERLAGSAFVGFGALIIAVLIAIWIGRRVARPLRELARQSEKVGALSLDSVERLPRSRVAELDQVAVAFNAMVDGLKAMNIYVPRSLFIKLMRLGGSAAAEAREAELTVLFTDIVGFTALSEHLSASETAKRLNDHFAILVDAVESSGGTVDKFIGDGMLAFWGAPDVRPDHAAAAVRTARHIARALRQANEAAEKSGSEKIRMRIGIHTGTAVVGNVGALDRWNYTVVGDTVNAAERLQTLGRDLGDGDEIVVLVSSDTVAQLPGEQAKEAVGCFGLRGRSGEMEVWKLDPFTEPDMHSLADEHDATLAPQTAAE